jgi:YggT family protein
MNPFIDLIGAVLSLYTWVLIIHIIISWLVSFNIINGYQPIVKKLQFVLYRLTEPLLAPIRKYMPDLGGIDLSPIVLFLLLRFTMNILYTYFYV